MQVEVLPDAGMLEGDHGADVVVVGSGIAGLSAAYELSAAGRRVVVVDRGTIAGGMTARTTAHLAPVCDDGIGSLIDLRGQDMARLFHESQAAAVDRIETITRELGIECDLRRLDGFLFPALHMDREAAHEAVVREHRAAREAGLLVDHASGVPFEGLGDVPALRYPRQATFHPLKYAAALARAVQANGGVLLANSPVSRIEAGSGGVQVVAEHGRITAEHAVVATNAPINKRLAMHSKMAPYRTYAMAFALARGTLPDALYWDMADPYHYVRLHPGTADHDLLHDLLIVGGEDHKSGEADDGAERFRRLEAWIRTLVPALGGESHRWSGQVMNTLDHCGYIGRDPDSDRVFLATGDSGQGMTHGVLAGILIRNLVLDGTDPWEAVYDPARKTFKASATYIRENATAARNFADYLGPGEVEAVDGLLPGQGGIVRDGVKRIAACRDLQGRLHVRSAVCSHLGCHVNWNSTEQCWDCPCHGSQFAPDGAVLNGPAVSPLGDAHIGSPESVSAEAPSGTVVSGG